jgi:Do/DeqQ family serine protease
MKKFTSTLAIGLLGGTLPLGAYLLTQNTESAIGNMLFPKTDQKIELFNFNKSTESKSNATDENTLQVSNVPNFVEASESSVNSVVHITTKVLRQQVMQDPFFEFFGMPGGRSGEQQKQYGQGSGSGVIISADGYIMTNNHVIEDATEIEVTLNDKTKYTAELIGTDPSTDIAVLKIKEKGLPNMVIGNSDNVKVGEWVLAVGNPFNLTSTVTAGIVSAKARSINILSDKFRGNQNVSPIESFIQTDAAVNPGNSGGALVNTKGELIGINTAIASQTGSYSGYSFAVPVNLAKKVMKDLIEYGTVQRGFIGVNIADITQELKEKESLPNIKGVYVSNAIESGAAAEAGIKTGDVITHIGSSEVNSVAKLQEEIGKRKPGDIVLVTVVNDKGTSVKSITLKNKNGSTKIVKKEELSKYNALGATFKKLSKDDKETYDVPYGVKIESINSGKLRALGIREGSVIVKFNQEKVTSPETFSKKLRNHKGGVLLEVVGKNGSHEYYGFGL